MLLVQSLTCCLARGILNQSCKKSHTRLSVLCTAVLLLIEAASRSVPQLNCGVELLTSAFVFVADMWCPADQPSHNNSGCSQHCAVCWRVHTPQAVEHSQHLGGGSSGCHSPTHGLGSSSRRAGARGLGVGSSTVLLAGKPWDLTVAVAVDELATDHWSVIAIISCLPKHRDADTNFLRQAMQQLGRQQQ